MGLNSFEQILDPIGHIFGIDRGPLDLTTLLDPLNIRNSLVPDIETDPQQIAISTDPTSPRWTLYGQRRVGGNRVAGFVTGDNNEYLHLFIVCGEGPYESMQLMLDAEVQTLDGSNFVNTSGGDYAGTKIRCKFHLGGASQTADTDAVSEITEWTTDHRALGTAYCYLRFEADEDMFASNRLPEISFLIEGRNDIFDPRDDSTGYTANAALCINHYLTTVRFGPNADYATEINETELIASANNCDESVSLDAGGSEARWEINGVVKSSANVEDNLGVMAASMGGHWLYSDGQFEIVSGYYRTPDFTLTKDQLLSNLKLRHATPRADRINTITGTFAGPDTNWRDTSYPARIDSAAVTADGEELPESVDFDLVTSVTQCQRAAEIILRKSRLMRRLSGAGNIECLGIKAGRGVEFDDFAAYGLTSAEFICTSLKPSISREGVTIAITLAAHASTVYDWTTADEGEFAPASDPGTTPAVDAYIFDNLTATTTAGTVAEETWVDLSWDPLPFPFADGVIIVEYKPSSGSTWEVMPSLSGTAIGIRVVGLDVDVYYDFRVRLYKVGYSGYDTLTGVSFQAGVFSSDFSTDFI